MHIHLQILCFVHYLRHQYLPRSSKISGNRKFSSDHNSARLFCRGVPVRSSRWVFLYILNSLHGIIKLTQKNKINGHFLWNLKSITSGEKKIKNNVYRKYLSIFYFCILCQCQWENFSLNVFQQKHNHVRKN